MGEPVRILDLARQVIRLAGLPPDVAVKIDIVGVRRVKNWPRKSSTAGSPWWRPNARASFWRRRVSSTGPSLPAPSGDLADAAQRPDTQDVTAMMRRLGPEYEPWRPSASSASE